MKHYVVYHNMAKRGKIRARNSGDPYSILTNRPVAGALGARVWLISGYGSPTSFQLHYVFTADRDESGDEHGFKHQLSGIEGIHFSPPVSLNTKSWFADLKATQFFSRGLAQITQQNAIEGLLAVVSRIQSDIGATLATHRSPPEVIAIFHNKLQRNAHNLFQRWREKNPNGFFINHKGAKNSLLHVSTCPHLGDTQWTADDFAATLTDKRKICARTIPELRRWAKSQALPIRMCNDCQPEAHTSAMLSASEYTKAQEGLLESAEYSAPAEEFEGVSPKRVETMTYRVLRDTALARRVKLLHEFECQLCGHTILLPDGSRYAEAHHIRPLGRPHDGPDALSNILCVCPNHHTELDYRITPIALSSIRVVAGHTIKDAHVTYHNALVQESRNA